MPKVKQAEETIPAPAETKTDETTIQPEAISASAFCDLTGCIPRVRFAITRLWGKESLTLDAWKIKAANLIN